MLVTQSCLTLCDPVDCSLPGSSVHGILQARRLEWAAILVHNCDRYATVNSKGNWAWHIQELYTLCKLLSVCPMDRPAGRAQTPHLPTFASPAVLCDWAVNHWAEILPQVGKASMDATGELATTSASITPLPLGPHTPGRSHGTV